MDAPVWSPVEEKGAIATGMPVTYSSSHESCPPPFNLTVAHAWCAGQSKVAGDWVQITAPTNKVWTRVETKGRSKGITIDYVNQYVKTYKVETSFDGIDWRFHSESGTIIIQGNTDRNSSKIHVFKYPITARMIRIIVLTWYSHPSMRFEAYYTEYVRVIYIYI